MEFEAAEDDAGKRLDRFVAERMPETSRARIQEWIRGGRVVVNRSPARASRRIEPGDAVSVDPAAAKPLHAFAEDIPLDILYEDDDLAAINKAAGMTVHAGAGVAEGTLVNALLHHFRSLSALGGELRPGIVHRLDRYTSGVLLVAKNDQAHRRLARQFESRKVRKSYWALVEGRVSETELTAGRLAARGIHPLRVEADGQWWVRLEMPIRRDPRHRTRMTSKAARAFVRHPADRYDPEESETPAGRPARTDLRLLRGSKDYSLLEVRIATGRTHQIRVHLSAIGHPVVGDRLYGAAALPSRASVSGSGRPPHPESDGTPGSRRPEPRATGRETNPEAAGATSAGRFFLHARSIELAHPCSHEPLAIEAPLPRDFETLLESLGV